MNFDEVLEQARFEHSVLERRLTALSKFIAAAEDLATLEGASDIALKRPRTRAAADPPDDTAPGPKCKTCDHPFNKHDPETGKCWQKVGRGTCLCGEFRS